MTDWAGHEPITYAEYCLNRLAVALEKLAAYNAPPAREPGAPLPDDFPGREALAEVGIVYLEDVPKSSVELADMGLDGRTISRVLTWQKVNG
jgi:hypothetical protein